MASSMLTGDRRWASTRKSGLTVLGKIPKPINLPSQRLENHGLDPDVEIVPKGTLSWGSRPSSASPNAWGTSSLSSPNTDGSAGSPSHLSFRPSSGGSGTRPSTAGSDRSHEPASNAWGPNSRPSSASGILTSSHLSATATRPQSAETRSGSSQLSRFADNSVDGTAAWGAASTANRLGTGSSKTSGFTMSSGDFPSLGSETNSESHSQRGHGSQGRPHSSQGHPHSSQGRPASASSINSKAKEFLEPQLAGSRDMDHSDHGTIDTWKADSPPYVGCNASPNIENWHRDPHQAQPYSNMKLPRSHYDSWHNPPFCPPDGFQYRGGAAGGPYGPPGSYYPHVPLRPPPTPDTGPGGYDLDNCQPFHPYTPPERYMGPVRPGAYLGPRPYDGYPPPASSNNSTEREVPIMGTALPPGHNQYPTQHQNYDSVNFHERPGGYATVAKEQLKSDHVHDSRGQYRVLLKQHDGSQDRDEWEDNEHSVIDLERGKHQEVSMHKGGWGPKNQTQERAISCQDTSGMDGQSTDTFAGNSLASSSSAADDGLFRRPDAANVQNCDHKQYPVINKKATLMKKVEGLNNKAHAADRHREGGPPFSFKEKTCFNDVTDVASTSNVGSTVSKESNRESTGSGKASSSPLNSVSAGENAHFLGQKKFSGAKGVDHHTKSSSNMHVNDERMKKPYRNESSVTNTVTCVEGGALERDASQEPSKNQVLHCAASPGDGSHRASPLDLVDHEAQRAKMREIAVQRAKQLQREEEERTREQKAKALAKLEELNRRTLTENLNIKPSHALFQISDTLNNKQESESVANPATNTTSVEASSGTSTFHSESVEQVDHNTTAESIVAAQASYSFSLEQETHDATKIKLGSTSDVKACVISKLKQVGYRKRHSQKQTTAVSTGSRKVTGEVAVNASSNDTLPINEDPSVHHKKNNRNAKNNNVNKLDEGLMPEELHAASVHTKPLPAVVEAISVPSESLNEIVMTKSSREPPIQSLNEGTLSELIEEAPVRVSSQWKPQPHKKSTRDQQINKSVSKHHGTGAVMWTPIKPLSKNEKTEEGSKNCSTEPRDPSENNGQNLQNGTKAKRAEMERDVPKPVAKELSEHVISDTSSPSIEESLVANDAKNPKHNNKHGRTNVSWRQRSSVESPLIEAGAVQKASDQLQTSNIDADDGWNDNNDNVPPSESVTSTVVTKSFGASRQRRQTYKVHKVHENSQEETTDKNEPQSRAFLGHNESEGRYIARTEGRNASGEHMKLQWQPKSQNYSHIRQAKTDAPQGTENDPTMNKFNHSSSQRSVVDEVRDVRNQEAPPNVGYEPGLCNDRFHRGHGTSYRSRDSRQDATKKNSPHVEYKQIGSYDRPDDSFQQNPNSSRGPHEVSRVPGYRERNRYYPRGGHFYKQNMGAATRVGESYNSGSDI